MALETPQLTARTLLEIIEQHGPVIASDPVSGRVVSLASWDGLRLYLWEPLGLEDTDGWRRTEHRMRRRRTGSPIWEARGWLAELAVKRDGREPERVKAPGQIFKKREAT